MTTKSMREGSPLSVWRNNDDISTMEAIRPIRAKRLAESVERDVQELLNTPWDAMPKSRPVHPYIQELKKIGCRACHRAGTTCRKGTCRKAQAVRERLTPLETRVSKLLATIPDAVQREGLSLASLQVSLRGRSRGDCHPGELGTALRKLGFTRQRQWRGSNGFPAVWRKQG